VIRARPVGSWLFLVVWPIVAVLASEPGRLNADTKYDLVGNPARLMRVALSTWDETRLGGWIPQQYAGYLWPSGPIHWLLQPLPDWVVQRLWLAVLVIVAGLGVRYASRHLGLSAGAATVAGVVYQISPYTVPYLSRTSAMLLPWALCGWILAAAVLATRRPAPRWLAVLALLFATAGGVNTTALLMVTPLPVLWFIAAARNGDISGLRAAMLSMGTAVGSALVAAWLVASAWIGSSRGPDLLSFSEDITDVAVTASGPEVLRSSGYWLTYAVEPSGVATTANAVSLTSSVWVVVLTFAVAVIGITATVASRWPHRWFAAAAVLFAVVAGVGVHPLDDPSPLGRALLDGLDPGALTAVRSSTRALPILALVSAIGVARVLSRFRPRLPLIGIGVALAATAAPWWSLGRVVDPALDRPAAPPSTWEPLLAAIDGAERVVVLPGTEFSTFTWGHTQDPPWTSTAPVITRELLPLGTPERMDLLYALDDAVQDGTVSPAAVVAATTWLGADHVWLAADVDTTRYGSASVDPDLLSAEAGAEHRAETSAGSVWAVSKPASDAAPVVELWGRGRGALSAASAGLITGETAVVPPGADVEAPVIITDGDRDVLRQWRGSQAVVGAVSQPSDRLRTDTASLGVADPVRTVAVTERDLAVTASGYGDAWRLLPEHRPAQALDGDPDTAWRVAQPSGPVQITVEGHVGNLAPVVVTDGMVGRVIITVDADRRDGRGPDVIERVPAADGTIGVIQIPDEWVRVTIDLVDVAPGTTTVGLAEITVEPAPEELLLPTVTRDGTSIVVERWRHERTDTGRVDPEPVMRRRILTEVDLVMDLHAVVDDRAPVTPGECISGVLHLNGVDVAIDPVTGGSCDGVPLRLNAGEHHLRTTLDLVALTPVNATDARCCATVLPRAFSDAATVSVDGQPVDAISLVGGRTAVLTATSAGLSVDAVAVDWTPDRAYTVALIVSAVAALLAVVIIIIDPGQHARPQRRRRAPRSRWIRAVIVGAAVAGLVDPVAGGVCAAVAVLLPMVTRWAMLVVAAGAAAIVVEVARDAPELSAAWPGHFGILHVPMTAAVVAACVVALVDEDAS